MPVLEGWGWVAVLLAAFLVGLSKTGIPGIGILAVALFATVIPARESAGIVLPLLICADMVAVANYMGQARWGHLFRIIPWAVAGILVGYFTVDLISGDAMGRLIGLILVGLASYQILGALKRRAELAPAAERAGRRPAFAAFMGLLAGFTTMVANAAGPVMSLYLTAMRFPKMEFLGTAAWYFFLLNSFKVPFSVSLGLITGETLVFNLKLIPAVLAGAVLGRVVIHFIPQRTFERIALGLAFLAGLRLLL